MDSYEIVPTSQQSAICEPLVLWASDERRLVFKPNLVENPNDRSACINGDILYQRKRRNEEWEDIANTPLNRLRAGEGVRINLQAGEVLSLVRHVAALYRFHASNSIPRRKIHLLRVDLASDDVDALQRLDVQRLLSIGRHAGIDVLAQLLEWLGDQEDAALAVEHLRGLGTEALQRISAAVGVVAIQSALIEWGENQRNVSEEYWQQFLARNAFVLSQAFSTPLIIIKSKAYLGGKNLENHGGSFVDYLASNPTTRNPLIIEIKTPTTGLLRSAEYRDGIYAPSEELSGGVLQLLHYRRKLLADPALTRGLEERVKVFAPQSMLLIGDTQELDSEEKARSFELARSANAGVMIVTYDELFGRLRALLELIVNTSGMPQWRIVGFKRGGLC